jgi:hypothetical protein
MTKLEWGVVFSLLASSASIIFSAGVIWTKLQQHDADISVLKVASGTNIDRLARIETKLDVILADKAASK